MNKKSEKGAARNYVWTLNNYTEEEIAELTALGTELPSPVQYIVWGKEKGESGTPHLQGYLSLESKKGFKFVRSLLPKRVYCAVAKGTNKQASDYCKKDGQWEEYGTLPAGKGHRTDLDQLVQDIKSGKTFRDIADEYPAAILRYGSGVVRLRHMYMPDRANPPEIHVFWGPTRSGKTRRVWEFADKNELWVAPGDRWFDGYDQHPTVLFDDFDGGWYKLGYLLKLLDRYPFQVPVKGGFVWWAPQHIFITSNINPEEWYANAHEEQRKALMARLREFGTIEHIRK